MKILVLFAQRVCSYPGQYQPETLAVVSEYENDDNPEYMAGKHSSAIESREFSGISLVKIVIPDKFLDGVFNPMIAAEHVVSVDRVAFGDHEALNDNPNDDEGDK